MVYFIFFVSMTIGFWISYLFSKADTKVRRRLPSLSLKIIELSPNVKIKIGRRVIHMHHWLNFSILLIVTLTFGIGILDNIFSKGFMFGGIIQGLTFPDWRQIVTKKQITN